MRVELEHVEKKVGLLSRQLLHGVKVHAHFSEEERHIIESRRLHDQIVLERPPSADLRLRDSDFTINRNGDAVLRKPHEFHLYIRQLVRGPDTYWLENPLDAKGYEEELTEKLQLLKRYITENEEVTEKSKTLEF